jgi:hypothetical protein
MVSFGIYLEQCLVDDLAFFIKFAICFVVFSYTISSEMKGLIFQVFWTRPIKGNIGKWSLLIQIHNYFLRGLDPDHSYTYVQMARDRYQRKKMLVPLPIRSEVFRRS